MRFVHVVGLFWTPFEAPSPETAVVVSPCFGAVSVLLRVNLRVLVCRAGSSDTCVYWFWDCDVPERRNLQAFNLCFFILS